MKLLLAALLLTAAANAAPPFIQNTIEQAMKEKEIPGLIAAYYDGSQEMLIAFGYADRETKQPVTPDTIFEIASITKVFTSTALALEVLRGRMELNQPVTRYLPPVRGGASIGTVNLAALATHTSSLPRMPPSHPRGYNPTTLMEYLGNWTPSYPIGTRYVYSNLGFGILGYAIANVERTSYAEMIQRLVLGPLGMTETEIFVPPRLNRLYAKGYNQEGRLTPHYHTTFLQGGGALRSTGRDMMQFLLANLGVRGPQELLKAMQFAQQGVFKANEHLTLGLGWQRFMHGQLLIIDKNGGLDGFSSYIGMLPDQKIGIVLLANKAKTDITAIGRKLLLEAHGHKAVSFK